MDAVDVVVMALYNIILSLIVICDIINKHSGNDGAEGMSSRR